MHVYGTKVYCVMLSPEFSLNVKNEISRIQIRRPWLIRVNSVFSFMWFKSVYLRLDLGCFFPCYDNTCSRCYSRNYSITRIYLILLLHWYAPCRKGQSQENKSKSNFAYRFIGISKTNIWFPSLNSSLEAFSVFSKPLMWNRRLQ